MVREINDADFEQDVIKNKNVSVVDFWAVWCGPCKMLGPVISDLSEELNGKAEFFKVNVDENPVISNTYKIASIPTVMIFKNGTVVDTMIGFRPKQQVKDFIERNL